MSRERMDTEEFAALVAAPLKAQVSLASDFDAKVMAAVAEAARPWWRRTHTFTFTPMRSMALAAGLAALMVLAGRGVTVPASQAAAASVQVDTVHLVRFVIAAPGAATVSLAGDFNGWSATATPLEDLGGSGTWVVSLLLTAGRHEYAFVVDGSRWVADPAAAATRDEFGQESSVLHIGGDPVRGT